jgi:hypothetical protein
VEGYVQILLSTAPIDDRSGTDNACTGRPGHLDRLAGRHARGDHVLHDEHALPWRQRKSAPKHEPAVLTLGENGPDAQRSPDFLPDDDAPEGGRQHDLRVQASGLCRNFGTTGLGFGRMLQNEGTLQIA